MNGISYKASVPKPLPSTVRSRKPGNRAQANATSSPRSAFVHANPVSHLVDAEHGLITGHSHRADHPGAARLRSPAGGARPAHRLALRHVPVTATGTGETGHDGVAAADLPPGLAQVRHLARHQIMGLTAAFLLGMAANLTGPPSQTRGAAHIARIAFLAGHVLIALGLIIGTALLLRARTCTSLPATICELVLRDGDGCPFLRMVASCSAVMAGRRVLRSGEDRRER